MDIWGIDYHWVNGLPISFFLGVVEAGKALANGVAAFGSRFKQGSLVVITGALSPLLGAGLGGVILEWVGPCIQFRTGGF